MHDPHANERLIVWLTNPENAAKATAKTREHWISLGIRPAYYDDWLALARGRTGEREPDLFG